MQRNHILARELQRFHVAAPRGLILIAAVITKHDILADVSNISPTKSIVFSIVDVCRTQLLTESIGGQRNEVQ